MFLPGISEGRCLWHQTAFLPIFGHVVTLPLAFEAPKPDQFIVVSQLILSHNYNIFPSCILTFWPKRDTDRRKDHSKTSSLQTTSGQENDMKILNTAGRNIYLTVGQLSLTSTPFRKVTLLEAAVNKKKNNNKKKQWALGPWRFADMMACDKRPSSYVSLVKTESSYVEFLLTKQPNACVRVVSPMFYIYFIWHIKVSFR